MANYTASDITTDEQAALDQIKEETEAAVKYDIAAKNAKDPVTKKAMEHNKKDEIEHAGLMGAVAVRENPKDKSDMMAGVKELDDIKTETAEESFIKKSISQCIRERSRQRRSSMGASFQFEKSTYTQEKPVPLTDLRRQAKVIDQTKPGQEDNLAANIRTGSLPHSGGIRVAPTPGLPWKHSKSYNPGGNVWRWGMSDLEDAMDAEERKKIDELRHRATLARELNGLPLEDFQWDDPTASSALQDRINQIVDDFIRESPAYDVPDRSILKKLMKDGTLDPDAFAALSPEEQEYVKSLFDDEGNIAYTDYENAVGELIDQLDDIMYEFEGAGDDEFERVVRPRMMPSMTNEEVEAAKAVDEANIDSLRKQGLSDEEIGSVYTPMSYDPYDREKSKATDLSNWHIYGKDMPGIINRGNKAAMRDYALRLAKARLLSQGHDAAGEDIGRLIAEDNGGWLSKRLKATLMWDLVKKGLAFNPEDFRDLLGDDLTNKAGQSGITSKDIEDYLRSSVKSEFDKHNADIRGKSLDEISAENSDANALKMPHEYESEVAKRMKAITDRYDQMYGGNYLMRNLPEQFRGLDTGLQLNNFAIKNDKVGNYSAGPRVAFSDDLAEGWVRAGVPEDRVEDFKNVLDSKFAAGEDIGDPDTIRSALDLIDVNADNVDMNALGRAVFVTGDEGAIDEQSTSASAPVLMNLYNDEVVKKHNAEQASEFLKYLADENNADAIREVMTRVGASDSDLAELLKTVTEIANYDQDKAYDSSFDDSKVKSPSIYNNLLYQRLNDRMRSDASKAAKFDAEESLAAKRESQALEDSRYFKDPANVPDGDEDSPSTNALEYLEKEGQDIEDAEAEVDQKVHGKSTIEEPYPKKGIAEVLKDQVETTTGNREALKKLIPVINQMGVETAKKQTNPLLRDATVKSYRNFIGLLNSASNDSWLGDYARVLTNPKYIGALNRALAENAPDVPQIQGDKLYAPQNAEAMKWLKQNGYLLTPSAENGISPGAEFDAGTDFKTRIGNAISTLDGAAGAYSAVGEDGKPVQKPKYTNGLSGLLDFLDNFPSASQLKARLVKEGLSNEEINEIMAAAEAIDQYRTGAGKGAAKQIRDIETRAAATPKGSIPTVLALNGGKPMKSEFHSKPWPVAQRDENGNIAFRDENGELLKTLDPAPLQAAPAKTIDEYNKLVEQLNGLIEEKKTDTPEYKEALKKYNKFIEKFSPTMDADGWEREWASQLDPGAPRHVGYTDEDQTAMKDIIGGMTSKGTHYDRKSLKEVEDKYSVADALKLIAQYGDSVHSPLDLDQAVQYAEDTIRGGDEDAIKDLNDSTKKMQGGLSYKDALGDFMAWASSMMKEPGKMVLGGKDTSTKDKEKKTWEIPQLAAATYVPMARERYSRDNNTPNGVRSIVMRDPRTEDLAEKNKKRAQIMQQLKDEFGEDTSAPGYADKANQLFMDAFLPDFTKPEVYAPHLLNMISNIYENDVYGTPKKDIEKIRKFAETVPPEQFIEVMEPLLYSLQDQLKKRDEDYDAFVTTTKNPQVGGTPLENIDNAREARSVDTWAAQYPGLKDRYTSEMPIPVTDEDKKKQTDAWTKQFLMDNGLLDYHTGRPVNISKIAPLNAWVEGEGDYAPIEYSDEVNAAFASLADGEAPAADQPAESAPEERRKVTPRKRWVKTGDMRGKFVDADKAEGESEKDSSKKEKKEAKPVTKEVKKSATESKCTRVRIRSDADDLPDDTGLTMKQLREPTIRDDAEGSSVKHMGDSVIKKSTSELMKERFSRRA